MESKSEEPYLRPLLYTSKTFYVSVGVLLIMVAWFGYAWWTQISEGLVVTGMRDWGLPYAGATWGIYISNFIWFVGVAHGGIAVSASIRIARLEKYKPIARMAELITVISLLMAALSIIFDLGRPDRVIHMFAFYFERVVQSPLIWDLTAIIAYFVLSATYLWLTMREDVATVADRLPRRWRWLYGLILVGYSPREKEKVERIAWWLALIIIGLMAMLSGGVIPWLFGLMSSQAGWYGAAQGPYFLAAALVSAIAGVTVIAALFRRLFKWEEHIRPEIFKGLGNILAVLTIIYLWFVLHEHLTMRYAGPTSEYSISEALLTGQFASIYWTMLIVGLIIPFAYLAVQAVRREAVSIGGTVVASMMILVALWAKRVLIVVPSLLSPRLILYPLGTYVPTWVEWSLVAGTFAIAALLYIFFVKLFPIMEVKKG